VRRDFLYSVSRDFIKSCRTPILVLPDDTSAHPLQSWIDVASLAPSAKITVFPWREPPDLEDAQLPASARAYESRRSVGATRLERQASAPPLLAARVKLRCRPLTGRSYDAKSRVVL
jgi:hypothetical protein